MSCSPSALKDFQLLLHPYIALIVPGNLNNIRGLQVNQMSVLKYIMFLSTEEKNSRYKFDNRHDVYKDILLIVV